MTKLLNNTGTRSFIWMEKSYLTFATTTGVALSAGVIAALSHLLISLASALSTSPEFFRFVSVVINSILSAD